MTVITVKENHRPVRVVNVAGSATAASVADLVVMRDATEQHRMAAEQASNSADVAATTSTQQANIAADKASEAGAAANAAGNSVTTATQQAGIATAQAGIATTKAGESADSAAQALLSKNASETAASNSGQSELAADSSKALAQEWADKAENSVITGNAGKYSAKHHATKAAASAGTASQKATEAGDSATLSGQHKETAESAASTATTKATQAGDSATLAGQHKAAAEAAAGTANAKAAEAGSSATTAGQHKASAEVAASAAAASEAKVESYALIVSSALIWRGEWDASTGNYPTPTLNPETADYYRISVSGAMNGAQGATEVHAGDYLHWNTDGDYWFKIDATDQVLSVNGKMGEVVLGKEDVGLPSVPNYPATDSVTDGSSNKLATAAAVKAANDNADSRQLAATAVSKDSNTGAANLPVGDISQRPAVPTLGQIRYNAETSLFEGFGTEGWANVGGNSPVTAVISKLDYETPCIYKVEGVPHLKAGTKVLVDAKTAEFAVDTAVTMPGALNAGENYAVWVKPDGTAVAIEAPTNAGPYNWGSPPVAGATLVGGFHYSLTAPGTTPATGSFATAGFTSQGGNYPWTQNQIDKIAGVNEYSIWDLLFRPKTFGLKGFVFDPESGIWVAAYYCGTNHIDDGPSRAGSNVASGTVLPKIPLAYGGDGAATYGRLSWYEASEIAQSHGCRLLDYQEFASAALGVTEGQSLGGASSTIPLTLRQPGYTSRIGLEQASGHQYTWGANAHGTGGSSWTSSPGRGSSYGTPYTGLFGGVRSNGSGSGSRAAYWDVSAWYSDWLVSLRAACDHLRPA